MGLAVADTAFEALVARVRALEDAINKLQTDQGQVGPSFATAAQPIALIPRHPDAAAEAPPLPLVLVPVETHSALHWEVVRYLRQNDTQVQAQQAAREAVVEALAHRLRASWPYAQLVCYGSMRTGLSTPTSDIDCVVLNPPPVASMQHAVYFLQTIFEQESWVVGSTALATAALPILKLQVAPEPRRPDFVFQVDVSLSAGPVHHGLIATHVFSGEIGERPPVRALTIIVKDYLARLGLNQTFTGGLCSHAIFLLARAYVVAAGGGTDGRDHAADLGQMLMGFFQFYGDHFDPTRVTVRWALRPREAFPSL
jgi:DNA polymerase sigma